MRLLAILVFISCAWVQPSGKQAIPVLYEYNTAYITYEPCMQQLIPAYNRLKIKNITSKPEKGTVRMYPSQHLEVAGADTLLYKAEPELLSVPQPTSSQIACSTYTEAGSTAPGFTVFQPPKRIA